MADRQISDSDKARRDLEEALRSCREQLAKIETMLLKSKQDNSPLK